MKFFQWYKTIDEELTYDDPLYIYIFGENTVDTYNYLEVGKSFRKCSVFVGGKDAGLIKRWIETRMNNETVVLHDENIFDKISEIMKRKIIRDIYDK